MNDIRFIIVNSINKLKVYIGARILLLVLLAFSAAACTDGVPVYDLSDHLTVQPLLEYNVEYGYTPVWLSSERIFLPFTRTTDLKGGIIYDLSTDEIRALQPSIGGECFRGEYREWSRLPNERLGFIYKCRDENLRFVSERLVAFDTYTGQFEILVEYGNASWTGSAGKYALAEALGEIIQESAGNDIYHKLHKVTLSDGSLTPFLSQFSRAGSPSWSPDEENLVFAAKDLDLDRKRNIFSGYFNLSNEINAPWTIYLADRNGENLEKLVSGVRFAESLKWSPTDPQLIAFSGEYDGKVGLWLLSINSKSLRFLWPEGPRIKLGFDWSPDGTHLILLDCVDSSSLNLCRPIVFKVPLVD